MQNQNYTSEVNTSPWLKILVIVAICGLILGGWLLFTTRSSTTKQLNAIAVQLEDLEASSTDGLDELEKASLVTIKNDLTDIETKTNDLPTDTKTKLEDLQTKVYAIESSSIGQTGATGPRGSAGADGTSGATGATGSQGPAGADGTFNGDAVTSLNLLTDDITLEGTTNQVTVDDNGTDTLTLSLPQSINTTANPEFNNLDLNGTLTVDGLTTLNDDTTITGLLSVVGPITATGSLTFGTTIQSTCEGLTGYVWVPGNPKFGTMPGFCVMKYEAKNDGSGNPVSTEGTTPWVSISQRTAQDEASSVCDGCHLITENEWMTIAENALWQSANWCNLDGSSCGYAPGTAGKYLAAGHNDNSPAQALEASSNDSEACFGTVTAGVNTTCGSAGTQKRTLTLSNGTVLWDIPGDVWEWTDSWIIGNEQPNDAVDGFAWHEVTAITKWKDLNYANPTNRGWNSSQRLGQIYTDGTSTNNTLYGFIRGGSWGATSTAGAFALNLILTPTDPGTNVGFRVAR